MGPGDNCMETRSQRPQSVAFVYCSLSGLQSNSSNAILLTEDDIPGASLARRAKNRRTSIVAKVP